MVEMEQKIKVCKSCKNSTFDYGKGIVCSLTKEKPQFEERCDNYVGDELQKAESPKHSYTTRNPKLHRVNSGAEDILNLCLTIWLVLGIILSLIIISTGVVCIGTEDLFANSTPLFLNEIGSTAGISLMILGCITLFLTVLKWAILKVIINISRNLFNLNIRVERISHK